MYYGIHYSSSVNLIANGVRYFTCISHGVMAFNKCEIKCIFHVLSFIDLTVRFIQDRFFGSEEDGSVVVILELVGGSSSRSFDVIVTPSEQSPVSAEGMT